MQLSVAVFVLIVVGAALLGLVVGLVLAEWRHRRRAAANDPTERIAAAEAERDEAIQAAKADEEARVAGEAELAEVRRRADTVEAELADLRTGTAELEHRVATAEQVAEDHRMRFRDIVGLESENATLRAIAARVPELEARLRAQEPATAETEPVATDDDTVIDLRDDITIDPT